MKKVIILIFMCINFSFGLEAQENDKIIDLIYLVDGSVYKGDILEHTDDILTLKLRGSENVITINPSEVIDLEVVESEVFSNIEKKKRALKKTNKAFQLRKPVYRKEYKFLEKGFYQTFNVQLNAETITELNAPIGQGFPGSYYTYDRKTGFGAYCSYGYFFRKELGIGLGLGLDYYSYEDGGFLMPIFLEMRGYLLKKNHSPFYQISTGLAFNGRVINNLIDSKSGFLFYPLIGYRFGGSSSSNFELGLGMKIQRFKYSRFNYAFNRTDINLLKYQRLVLSLGYIF